MSIFSEVITSYVDLDHSIRFVWATGQEAVRKSEIRSVGIEDGSPSSVYVFINLDRRVGKVTLDTATLTSPDPSGSQATMLSDFESAMEDASSATFDTLFLTEQASADADVAGQGQFWVRSDTPNIPMFY